MPGSQWSLFPQLYSQIPIEVPTATNKKFPAMQICFAFSLKSLLLEYCDSVRFSAPIKKYFSC